jgi:hypothetical protein
MTVSVRGMTPRLYVSLVDNWVLSSAVSWSHCECFTLRDSHMSAALSMSKRTMRTSSADATSVSSKLCFKSSGNSLMKSSSEPILLRHASHFIAEKRLVIPWHQQGSEGPRHNSLLAFVQLWQCLWHRFPFIIARMHTMLVGPCHTDAVPQTVDAVVHACFFLGLRHSILQYSWLWPAAFASGPLHLQQLLLWLFPSSYWICRLHLLLLAPLQ